MPRCGCGGSCSCALESSLSVLVSGTGSPDDPYTMDVADGVVGSGGGGSSGPADWNTLLNKPTTFAPITGTTPDVAKPGDYQPSSNNITDATTIGRQILVATSAAQVRSLIGAATSTGTFDGSYASLTGKPTIPSTKADIGLGSVDNTSDVNKPISSAAAAAFGMRSPTVEQSGSSYPARPAFNGVVFYVGSAQPTGGGSVAGGGGSVDGRDVWLRTAAS